jgi:hypothetical protein
MAMPVEPFMMQPQTLKAPGLGEPAEQDKLAALIEQMKADKNAAAKTQEAKDTGAVQGAGIQAAAQLVGGLMSNAAAAERAKKEAMLESNKTVAETQAKGAAVAGQAQQEAFARLMGSMRSALT